jgi:hypothetical protein
MYSARRKADRAGRNFFQMGVPWMPVLKKRASANGMHYYTDRTYQDHQRAIRIRRHGRHPDAERRSQSYRCQSIILTCSVCLLTVRCTWPSTAGRIHLPDWMNGFIDTGDIIKTSLSTQPCLKIYRKSFAEDDCVNFGANKAPGFSGDTVSNSLVFYCPGGWTGACSLDSRFAWRPQ